MKIEKKNQEKKRFKANPNIIKELAPYMNLGVQIAVSVSLGALLGWWLDGKFDTEPIMILIFSFIGIIVGFYSFFKTVFDLEKKRKKNIK